MTVPVEIVDYDPQWPATFCQLRDRIAAVLGPLAIRIEHVGSTAVPGLAAKPIIDLDVVIGSRINLPAVISRLGALGYDHEGDLGIPGREAFITPPGAPAHHLYVCAADSLNLRATLPFATHCAPTPTSPAPTPRSNSPLRSSSAPTGPPTVLPRPPSSNRYSPTSSSENRSES